MIIDFIEDTNKPGIYEIRNLKSNKSYIGQSKKIKDRWKEHRRALICGTHKNKSLTNSFNLWLLNLENDDFIEFRILEVMSSSSKEERNLREKFWINHFQTNGIELYNHHLEPTKESKRSGGGKKGATGRIPWNKGLKGSIPWNKGKKMSVSHRQKSSDAHKGQKPFFKKGIKRPEITGKNHPMFGKNHSEDSRKKQSESAKKSVNTGKFKKGHITSAETRKKMGRPRPPIICVSDKHMILNDEISSFAQLLLSTGLKRG